MLALEQTEQTCEANLTSFVSNTFVQASRLIAEYGAVMHIPNPDNPLPHEVQSEPPPQKRPTTSPPTSGPVPPKLMIPLTFPKAHPPRLIRQVTTTSHGRPDQERQRGFYSAKASHSPTLHQPYSTLLGESVAAVGSMGAVGSVGYLTDTDTRELTTLLNSLEQSQDPQQQMQPVFNTAQLSTELLSTLAGAVRLSSE